MNQLILFLFYFFSPPSGLGWSEAVVTLNGLFSPLSLKEPDTCVHPKEVCSSSAVLQGQSLPCMGQRQAMHPQLRLMALLQLHFHLIFYFIFFLSGGSTSLPCAQYCCRA